MEAVVDSDFIQEAIKIISRLAPPTSGNINIKLENKNIRFLTQSDRAQCNLLIPGKVKGNDCFFAVPLDALREATKGRGEVDLIYAKQMLNVSQGKYKVSMATVDAIMLTDEEGEKQKSEKPAKWKVPEDHGKWLKDAVNQVALKPTALTQTFMPLSVKLTSKKAFVACHDTHRMSFASSKDVTGDIEFTLPLETLQSVLEVFHVAPFTMELTKSEVKITNKVAEVQLALPYVDEGEHLSIEDVMQIAKHTSSTDGNVIELDKDVTLKFLDSTRAIASKERPEMNCELDKGSVTLRVRTANGSAKESFKAVSKKKGKFNIDLEYFDEAARKAKTLSFKLVADEFVMFNTSPNSSIVVSLNQESGE
jgi:hypothetical protein